MNIKLNLKGSEPKKPNIEKQGYIERIGERIKELDQKIVNYSIDIFKNKARFEKTLKSKYAGRVMISENKIIKTQKTIQNYKDVRTKFLKELENENDNESDSINFAGGAI